VLNKTMPINSIVGFIDILGYDSLVKKRLMTWILSTV